LLSSLSKTVSVINCIATKTVLAVTVVVTSAVVVTKIEPASPVSSLVYKEPAAFTYNGE
jgi:hypothetical protein